MVKRHSTQTFGEFTETVPSCEEYLTLHFSPTSVARKRRWSNYGMSADFLGDYFAAFFPGDTVRDSPISQKDTVKGAVSYVANELLENAVKYSDESVNLPVSISLYLYDQLIILRVISYANLFTVEKYQRFIEDVLSSDLDEFYCRQLEQTALGCGGSNMGLLTMMYDYSARFGWKFQPLETTPEVFEVNVLARLICE